MCSVLYLWQAAEFRVWHRHSRHRRRGWPGSIVPGSWRCDAYRCFRRKITLNNVAQTKRPAKVHLSQIYVPRLYRKWIIYWRSAVDQSACPSLGSQLVDDKRIYLVSDSRGPYSCQQSYLLLFGIPSPTHSFIPGLKPSFSVNPLHCSPSFLLLHDSLHGFRPPPDCLLLFLSTSVFYF